MEWSKEKQTPQIDHSQTSEERRGAANGRQKIKQSHQGPVVHSCGTLWFPAHLLNKVSCFRGQKEPWSTKSLLQAPRLQTRGSLQLSPSTLASLFCFLCHPPALLLPGAQCCPQQSPSALALIISPSYVTAVVSFCVSTALYKGVFIHN